MGIGSAFRISTYLSQSGRTKLTPAQRRRARHKMGRALRGSRAARPFKTPLGDDKARTGSWHSARALVSSCLHCYEGDTSGHYHCPEDAACQDCTDDAVWASENIAAGYGAHGEDTGSDYDDPYGY